MTRPRQKAGSLQPAVLPAVAEVADAALRARGVVSVTTTTKSQDARS